MKTTSGTFTVIVIAILFMNGCSTSSTSTTTQCTSSSACDAGSICENGSCIPLCSADNDCQHNEICNNATARCEACANCRSVPQITAINGTGTADTIVGHATHHIRDSILLTGNAFLGGAVTLSGGNYDHTALAVRGDLTNTSVEVLLPPDLAAGTYTLSISNQAGRDDAQATVLQGEQGIPGVYAPGDGIDINGDTIGVVFGMDENTVAKGSEVAALQASLATTNTNLETTNSNLATTNATLSATTTTTNALGTSLDAVITPCFTSTNTLGTQTYDATLHTWSTCVSAKWNCTNTPTHAGCPSANANTRGTYQNCKDILDSGYSGVDTVFWIDADGSDGMYAPTQAYCDMQSDGGGWTLAVNLDTSDADTRGYGASNDPFWTGTGTQGSVTDDYPLDDAGSANDYKSPTFSTMGVSEIMLLAHQQGLVIGYKFYTLLSSGSIRGKTLQYLFANSAENTTITLPPRRAVSGGAIGSNSRSYVAGDLLIDQTAAIIVNYNRISDGTTASTSSQYNKARLAAAVSSAFAVAANNVTDPWKAGGWGGSHESIDQGWLTDYEGSAYFRYNSSGGGGCYGSNFVIPTPHSGVPRNICSELSSGANTATTPAIDLAIFIR